ncbi:MULTISPECIES: mandelate racemase/muconate lactonizing enzyme family protein [unclassified Flammeovirga]|uniref:mandelate racemase/muconate lactonizing enzyme family protein n=1 Tax=unclassified Flammeovirga TaxID=2637820 RepID=UPI0005C6F3BA|nr:MULTISPECIES: mandelate racemase/muconate lactonizing enzyme family protein [unclassified Flammeovirga]MBD0402316.1 mandelate racemase/muconate lactonizing enzyme family protein [Flammeovirga sp. EKP202]
MKIVDIIPYVIAQDLEKPFYFSQWDYKARKICLVKIILEDGTYGWGEGYGPADMIETGINFLKPFVIGENVLENEKIWQNMYLRTLDFGRSGIFNAAISAIDVGIWDCKGKVLNQPVSVLLGGVKNEIIHPYATGFYFTNSPTLDDDLREEAQFYKREGFKAAKMKVGLGLEKDLHYIHLLKEELGDDVRLMIDSNHAYNYREALELCNKIEHLNIGWFEEPVHPEDYKGYAKLRENTSIPIAGGECEYLKHGFKRLFDANAVDIAQPDLCATGGLTEMKRIATLASSYHKDIVPHSWGTWIAISAAIHFVSNLDQNPGRMYRNAPMIELDRTENPLRDDVVTHAIKVENGEIKVPQLPGLGIDVNQNYLEKYAINNRRETATVWS